jgi:hypothetical protein
VVRFGSAIEVRVLVGVAEATPTGRHFRVQGIDFLDVAPLLEVKE